MKIAIAHDFLRSYGGAERVVEALHELFPKAPVYTSYYDPKGLGEHAKNIKTWEIKTSWLQHVPYAKKLLSPMHLFAPLMFESFNLSEYEVVISSTADYFAKAVVTSPKALHISYIHTPPRHLYGFASSFDYKKNILIRILGEISNHILRIVDFEVSQRPDILVANSQNVAKRIKKFYRREARVIYPPVDVDSIKGQVSSIKGKDYYLSLGRLVRGKGTEVIVQACSELNLPLKVAGGGPELSRLKIIAGKTVEFVGNVSDEERIKLLARAKATIVASEDEDFGIVPVESMASGTPVIAVKAGGFLETVVEGKTGEFFDKATVESLKKVLAKFDLKKYKAEELRKQAEKFSKERFQKQILELIKESLKT